MASAEWAITALAEKLRGVSKGGLRYSPFGLPQLGEITKLAPQPNRIGQIF